MPWMQLECDVKIKGKHRSKGDKFLYGYHAGLALQARGIASWCDAPGSERVEKAEPKKIDDLADDTPEPGEIADDVEYDEPDPNEPDLRPVSERAEDIGWPTAEGFIELSLTDQKDVIRRAGLAKDCDLRRPDQMAIVYGAWLVEQEE